MLSSGLFCLDPAEIVGFVPYRLNQERAEWTVEKKNKIKILIFFPYFFFKVKKKNARHDHNFRHRILF